MEINKIYNEDCLETMARMSDNYIDLTVTSPPYDNLRNYNGYSFDFENIAKELYRVTKIGGIVVWIVGDATINKSETGTSFKQALYFVECGFNLHDTMIYEKNGCPFPSKKNGNRYSQIFEFMFVFSKDTKPKTTNLICDKPNKWAGFKNWGKSLYRNKEGDLIERKQKPTPDFSPRNNIWKYNTGKGYSTKDDLAFKHPAIFPEKLARDHILSWSNEVDLVYDCFSGSGTTLKMAHINNRNWIGSEISKEYIDLSYKRLKPYLTQTSLF
tara:strand:+ start:43 stop:852 length:810 start_codon:yes stop_codon:yes gene_type:complete